MDQNKKETDSKEYLNTIKSKIILLTYLIIITATEIIISYNSTETGFIIYLLLLIILLIHSSFANNKKQTLILRSILIIPVIRIINLSILNINLNPIYWFILIALTLFIALFTLIRTENLNKKDIGLTKGNIPVQIAIALTGIVIGIIEYQILKPNPLIPSLNIETLLIASIIIIIATGLAEELLFRGIIQKNATSILGSTNGIIYTSIFYTSLNIEWKILPYILLIFIISLFYSYLFEKTKSILGISLSHGIANVLLFIILPFF